MKLLLLQGVEGDGWCLNGYCIIEDIASKRHPRFIFTPQGGAFLSGQGGELVSAQSGRDDGLHEMGDVVIGSVDAVLTVEGPSAEERGGFLVGILSL